MAAPCGKCPFRSHYHCWHPEMGGHGRRTHIEWHVVAAEWMRWPPRWTKSQETASSIQQHGSSSQQPAGRTSLNVNLIALFQPQITKRVLHKAANMSSLAPVSSSTRSSSRSRFSPRFSTLYSLFYLVLHWKEIYYPTAGTWSKACISEFI